MAYTAPEVTMAPTSRIPIRLPPHPEYTLRRQRTCSAPSKLQRLQADFQRKIFFEKESKMVAHFLNMEERIIQRTTSGKSVREFFSERRQPPGAPWHSPSSGSDYNQARMAQHFRRTTGPNRNPSGRDRAKPLAPLNRTAPAQRSPQNSGRSGTKNTPPHSGRVLSQLPPRSPLNSARNLAPLPNVGQKSSNNNHQPTPPKENKPKYVRTMRRNSKGSPTEDRLQATPPKRVAKPGGAPRNGLRSDPRGADITSGIPAPDSGRKLSEFQQWQLEQQKAKEERLARFREGQTDRIQNHAKWEENNNTVNNVTNARKPGQLRTQIDRKPQPLAKQTRNGMQQTGRNKFQQNQRNNQHPRILQVQNPPEDYSADFESDEEDLPSYSGGESSSPAPSRGTPASRQEEVEQMLLAQKEQELMAVIDRQRAELARIQQENQEQEERERRAALEEQKRQAAQAERARRLQQAGERFEAGSHPNRRGSVPSSPGRRGSVPSSPGRRESVPPSPKSKVNPSPRHREPSPRSRTTAQPQSQANSNHSNTRHTAPNAQTSPKKTKPKSQWKPPEQPGSPVPPPKEVDTSFYENMARQQGAQENVKLASCQVCGRNFARDRLEKHMKVCSKATTAARKRKVFDPHKMRVQGTEFEKFTPKNPSPEKKKKSNWRTKHEEFIRNLRYAKQVATVEATGGNIAALPPPPPAFNPDYVQCPHCERRFNDTAAERHIPRCKDIKGKPLRKR